MDRSGAAPSADRPAGSARSRPSCVDRCRAAACPHRASRRRRYMKRVLADPKLRDRPSTKSRTAAPRSRPAADWFSDRAACAAGSDIGCRQNPRRIDDGRHYLKKASKTPETETATAAGSSPKCWPRSRSTARPRCAPTPRSSTSGTARSSSPRRRWRKRPRGARAGAQGHRLRDRRRSSSSPWRSATR